MELVVNSVRKNHRVAVCNQTKVENKCSELGLQ